MDTDAIDLTVPLEELWRKSNWPATGFKEELSLLPECEQSSNNKDALKKFLNICNDIPKKPDIISLETVLGFQKKQPPAIDTILISDDDEPEESNSGESESVTEVEVEEVSDHSNGCSRGSSSQCEFGAFEVTSSGKISSESVETSVSSWTSSQSRKQEINGTNPEHAHLIFKGKVIQLPIAGSSTSNDHWDKPDMEKVPNGQSLGHFEHFRTTDSECRKSEENPSEDLCDSDLKDPRCETSVINGSVVDNSLLKESDDIAANLLLSTSSLKPAREDTHDLEARTEDCPASYSSNAPKKRLCQHSSTAKSERDSVSESVTDKNSLDAKTMLSQNEPRVRLGEKSLETQPKFHHSDRFLITGSSSNDDLLLSETSAKNASTICENHLEDVPMVEVTSIAELICDERVEIPDGEYELTPHALHELPLKPPEDCLKKSVNIDAPGSKKLAKSIEVEVNSLPDMEVKTHDPPANRGLNADLEEEKGYLTSESTKTLNVGSKIAMLPKADKEEQASEDETEIPAANAEEIRKSLKLQLSNLRGRKKMNIFQQMANENQLSTNSNSGKASDDSNLPLKVVEDRPNLLKLRRSWPVDPDSDSSKNATECNEDEGVPNVFNEIRKIIRKSKMLPAATVSIKVRDVTAINEKLVDSEKTPEVVKPQQSSVQETAKSEESSNSMVGSPFISNSLDEFLIDAKLNVSYTIPKSGAEEGLKQDYSAVDPVIAPKVKVKERCTEKPKKRTHYKAKTLAEKRKILEKLKSQEERRLKKQKRELEQEHRSYVWFKNKKIYVKSKLRGKCLASIKSTMKCDVPDATSPKKLSLLTELNRRKFSVEYKAGPLSKKHLLQANCPGEWGSELKSLPNVALSVSPEFGKPVPDHILPLIVKKWDGLLGAEQVEFALTALAGQSGNNQRIFQFPVSYENGQEKVLVQKKMDQAPIFCNAEQTSGGGAAADSVSDIARVVADLINYVDIKEMAGDLVKEPEDVIKEESAKEIEWDTMKAPIKSRKRRTCMGTKRELLRLNCKVVTMEANVSAQPSKACTKSYCQLGCVCESLKCETIIGIHCRKFACMFECFCPKRQNAIINISAPSNSDSTYLSRDAVNRIEDEAKKNLAREEREFTQTIIYSNDSAIVLGSGNKPRRAARAPKKYTDFFEEPIEEKPPTIMPCSVSMENLNLSSLMPFCMEHRVHDCQCGGHDMHHLKREARLRDWEANYAKIRKRPYKISFWDNVSKVGSKKARFDVQSEAVVETLEWGVEANSARTRGFAPKHRKLSMTNPVVAASGDYINSISQSELLLMNQHTQDAELPDSKLLKIKLVREMNRSLAQKAPEEVPVKPKNKRKQQLQVRKDVEDPLVVEHQSLLKVPAKIVKTVSEPAVEIPPVFPGEIIVKDSSWLKCVYTSGKELLNSYARILPWPALLAGFLAKTINVYFIREMRLVMNVGKELSGKNYFNIEIYGQQILDTPMKSKHDWLVKQSDNVRDIIKWLLAGTLSSKYTPSTLSFLLVETLPKQFEVRGLCTQNPKSLNICSEESVSDEITEIKHKTMKNEVSSLFITKWNYQLRRLEIKEPINEIADDASNMWVALPDLHHMNIKWRVVFLKREFLYLFFKKVRYSIKYNDLIKLTEIASQEQRTVMVRNAQIRRNHHQSLFGLYVTSEYADRVFIGPYSSNFSEDDIDTLMSMNKSLISCETYYRIKDVKYTRDGWLYDGIEQKSDPLELAKELESPNETASVPNATEDAATSNQSLSKDEKIIMHNGVQVVVKNSKARTPSEFNRYGVK